MKQIIITIGVCMAFVCARAQEWSIELDGGLQGLQYDLPGAKVKQQLGGSLGLQYTFFFGKHFGLVTGINGGLYNTKTTLNDGTILSTPQIDETGSAFQYNVKTVNYSEKQKFIALNIPIMFQYHTSGDTQWYMNLGGKVFLPFNLNAKATADQLALSGDYPDSNIDVDDLPQHGFGTVSNWSGKTDYKLKPTVTASAATGISFKLGNGTRLYTGLYFDYGLTDMRNKDEQLSLVDYTAGGLQQNVKSNSVLKIQETGDVKLLGYGVQVRFWFGKKKPKPVPPAPPAPPKKEEPKKEPEPVVVPEPTPEPAPEPQVAAQTKVFQFTAEFGKVGNKILSANAKSDLDKIAEELNEYPDIPISIIGHTCDLGSDEINQKLGLDRANAVANYLQSKGVSRSRMEVSSAGSSQPLVPNTSEENRKQNRRVEIRATE